jgi:hypothetical protein
MNYSCYFTDKGAPWVIYHLRREGHHTLPINSISAIEPPSIWSVPPTYVIDYKPQELPPWANIWVCNQRSAPKGGGVWVPSDIYPNYCMDILRSCAPVLVPELCKWLLCRYRDNPASLERLVLIIKVLAHRKGEPLTVEDVQPYTFSEPSTPFLHSYKALIGAPQGLPLIYGACNTDLWRAFMLEGGLMKYLKVQRPPLVHSLMKAMATVRNGTPLLNAAILWHLSTMGVHTNIQTLGFHYDSKP